MSEPIVYVDRSAIRPGSFEALRTAIAELAEFVEANEPEIVAYNAYFAADESEMTVIHVHRDSKSLEFHMRVAGSLFPKFARYIDLRSIDVYGDVDDALAAQLRHKAETLGTGSVTVHRHGAGFVRS